MRFILVTGMSGAGKTAALRFLEDMGAFCVDNLPPSMMVRLIESCEKSLPPERLAAFSMDARSGALFDARAIVEAIHETRQLGHPVEVLFLDASDDTLVERYKETRREHPLAGSRVTLTGAILAERSLVQPLREVADYIIDTTALRQKALQKQLQQIFGSADQVQGGLRVEVMSFGFKRGIPRQADLVFDVRFLPNPFYIPELCRHTGLDADVRAFVMGHPATKEFMERMGGLLTFLLPKYVDEGKHRLVIAVGCTGGAHRSVAICEAVAALLREAGYAVETGHRDMDLEQARWTTES